MLQICFQPTHPGTMVQVGLCMGPRHARVLGPAVSYTKKLPEDEKMQQDRAIVGLTGIIWATVKSAAPLETTIHADREMEALKMPRLATRHVAPGESIL